MFIRYLQRGCRLHVYMGVEGRGEHRYRRLKAEPVAGNHADAYPQAITDRQAFRRVMAVAWCALLKRARRCQPDLQAVQARATGKRIGRCALDMRHTTASGHPADIAWPHMLRGP
ncbi:hypothetical protein D3C76_1105460 [compost metagenome]